MNTNEICWIAYPNLISTETNLMVAQSLDGINYGTPTNTNLWMIGTGGSAMFDGTAYIATTAPNTNPAFQMVTSLNGTTFVPKSQGTLLLSAAPGMAVFKGKLCVAYAALSTNYLTTSSSSDGTTFAGPTTASNNTLASGSWLALAVFNGVLWAAYRGTSNNQLYLCYSTDGVNFTTGVNLGAAFQGSPAMTVWNNQLHVVAYGTGGDAFSKLSSDGVTWPTPWTDMGFSIGSSPAVTVLNGNLIVAFKSASGNFLGVTSSADGTTFAPVMNHPSMPMTGAPSLLTTSGYNWNIGFDQIVYAGNAGDLLTESASPQTVWQTKVQNTSDAEIAQQVSHTTSQDSTFALSFTETMGLTITNTVSVTVDVPGLASATASVSIEYSFEASSTQAWTTTNTEEYDFSETLTIPANTSVNALATLTVATNVVIPYTMTFIVSATSPFGVALTSAQVQNALVQSGCTGTYPAPADTLSEGQLLVSLAGSLSGSWGIDMSMVASPA